jgi:hypothetical protein
VEHGADPEALCAQLTHDAVDQKGGIRLNHLQPVTLQIPSVGAERRHEAHLGLESAGLRGVLSEAPEIEQGRRQVLCIHVGNSPGPQSS